MKPKININRPEIKSEEIMKRKDFNSVLKHYTGASKPFFKKPLFLSSIVVSIVAIVVSVVLLNNKHQLTTNNEKLSTSIQQLSTKNQQPTVNPPLKGLNIDYTTYKVIAESGASLDFKSGSKLIIPQNVFADENGNLLKGEIELRYREFHDAVDFFVSGIPMTYDSAGVKYHFESAGMMEMLAYQNGKQVKMVKDKSINVEMASNIKGTEYNLYKLDTLQNNWSCLGKDKVVEKPAVGGAKPVSKEIAITKAEETPEYKKIETKKEVIIKEKEKQIASLPKPTAEPRKPVEARKEKHTFDIAVDPTEFPELAVYKGVWFEVGDENKNFSTLSYDIIWDDAALKEGTKKGENYQLTLTKGSKVLQLIVYPVFEGKSYQAALKNYETKFEKYTAVIEKRKEDEKRIEEEAQARLLAYNKQQEEIARKWKEEQENQYKLSDTQEKVTRMFTINSFGIFNSDCPHNYPQGVLCTANLVKDKNAQLDCYNIYLVDKARTALFTYYKNPVAQFTFNPQSKNMIWTVENGVLYWLKPEQFKDINGNNGMNNLKMNKVEQKFASVEEMKAYFNF